MRKVVTSIAACFVLCVGSMPATAKPVESFTSSVSLPTFITICTKYVCTVYICQAGGGWETCRVFNQYPNPDSDDFVEW